MQSSAQNTTVSGFDTRVAFVESVISATFEWSVENPIFHRTCKVKYHFYLWGTKKQLRNLQLSKKVESRLEWLCCANWQSNETTNGLAGRRFTLQPKQRRAKLVDKEWETRTKPTTMETCVVYIYFRTFYSRQLHFAEIRAGGRDSRLPNLLLTPTFSEKFIITPKHIHSIQTSVWLWEEIKFSFNTLPNKTVLLWS